MAVVKIEATGLPFVKIGDVNRLKVGEWVMAIGSPFGLDNTVTAGIVSAKQRDTGDYLPFIQTDVAINPGNSGGPLLNLRGEVVGINSQIYSRSGGFMGISFAIPIDEATRVADQLRTSGRVIRGRIGVEIAPVTKEVAESIGLGKPRGALVRSVETDGPADKAGVEAGDIIIKVDGKPVEKSGDLPRIIGGIKPGTQEHAAGVPPRRRRGHQRSPSASSRPTGRRSARPPSRSKPATAPARSALGHDRGRPDRGAEAGARRARRRARRGGRRRGGARRPARGRRDPARWTTPRSPTPSSSPPWRRKVDKERAGQRAGAARQLGQLPADPPGR